MRLLFLSLVSSIALAALTACSSSPHTVVAQLDDTTVVVLGVQADDIGKSLTTVHVVASVDGVALPDQTFDATKLPFEVRLVAPSAKRDARIDLTIGGIMTHSGPPAPESRVVITRLATTAFVPGETRLLRVRLGGECLSKSLSLADDDRPIGLRCDAPTTCINGACASSTLSAAELEPYAADWANHAPDHCRSENAGPPEVLLGVGETAWAPLAAGDTVTVVEGPQGGYHIWFAIETKNLGQYGSTTTLSATQPSSVQADGGTAVPPTSRRAPYLPKSNGYCEVAGSRLVLGNSLPSTCPFLGKPLDVTLVVTDGKGASARTTTRVQIPATVGGAHCP